MDQQAVVHLYDGVLLSNEKEPTIDTCSNLNEYQNNYAKWKKSDTKDHKLYGSIIWNAHKKQIYRDRK